jgi:hypothetical protein
MPDLECSFSEREANPQPAESLPPTFVVLIPKVAMTAGREPALTTVPEHSIGFLSKQVGPS